MSEIGLRERKKQRMYQVVSDIAIRLFLEKGFDAVSVAEVAAAAEISKPTLFPGTRTCCTWTRLNSFENMHN